MSSLILPKTKMMLSASKHLQETITDLNQMIDISVFACTRVYADSSLIDTCNNAEILENIYYNNQKLYEDAAPDICPEMLEGEYLLLPCYDTDNPSLDYLHRDIHISHVLTITKRRKGFYETFWFGSDAHDKFVNFCINKLDKLEAFIQYFSSHYKTLHIMKKCENDKMIRQISKDTKMKNQLFIEKYKVKHDNNNEKCNDPPNIFREKKNKRYFVPGTLHTYLTQREMDCLYWCVEGKKNAEIAISLQIAKKTVDCHIDNIKQKLDCNNKTSLVKKALSLRLFTCS